MKLYYAPGACSIGIHVILEEIGDPYTIEKLDLQGGEQHRPPFSEINPKGKVPTLERDDGKVLTEFPAIAFFLARRHRETNLLPVGMGRTAKALELMDYIVGTIHGKGFALLFRPSNYAANPADEEKVKEMGKEVVTKAFAQIERELGDKEYLLNEFSVVDAALFYVELWAAKQKMELPMKLAAHLQRMLERPAVQLVLKAEGLD